ncbi:hypothetical protein C5S35_01305, partial [Candidatus Methanophagaceae archaeon]
MKSDLNAYRRYCDQAADLLETTEEKAPRATKLIRKGLPIFNQRIKELLDGIDKETTILCDAVRGTEAEEFVKPTCKGVRELIKIRNPIELDKRISGLIPNLRFMVENLPERERDFGYDKIETLDKEDYLEDKLSLLNELIVFVAPHISLSKDLERLENKLYDILISLEPGIRQELTVTVGAKAFGTGLENKITIPLQEIKYSELEKDLESIKSKSLTKLASLPPRLAEKENGQSDCLLPRSFLFYPRLLFPTILLCNPRLFLLFLQFVYQIRTGRVYRLRIYKTSFQSVFKHFLPEIRMNYNRGLTRRYTDISYTYI